MDKIWEVIFAGIVNKVFDILFIKLPSSITNKYWGEDKYRCIEYEMDKERNIDIEVFTILNKTPELVSIKSTYKILFGFIKDSLQKSACSEAHCYETISKSICSLHVANIAHSVVPLDEHLSFTLGDKDIIKKFEQIGIIRRCYNPTKVIKGKHVVLTKLGKKFVSTY